MLAKGELEIRDSAVPVCSDSVSFHERINTLYELHKMSLVKLLMFKDKRKNSVSIQGGGNQMIFKGKIIRLVGMYCSIL